MTRSGVPALCALMLGLFSAGKAAAQTRVPCNQITEEMGFTVRSIRVVGRWVPEELLARVRKIVRVGEEFSPAVLGPAQSEVSKEIDKMETRFPIQVLGATSALYVDSDVCDVSDRAHPKQVAIIIRPYYVRVDLLSIGANILPIPRGVAPAFYERVPAALFATNPRVRLLSDRQYGTSLGLQTRTDLLNSRGRISRGNGAQARNLALALDARRSLSRPFYNLEAAVTFARPEYSGDRIGWELFGGHAKSLQPLGMERYRRDRTRLELAIQGRRKLRIIDVYMLGGGVRFAENRYAPSNSSALKHSETGVALLGVGDGRIGRGFSRVGLWFDAGLRGGAGTYQRLAARTGYATELGRGHNSIGLELVMGAGGAWGNSPAYSRFFGGNAARNFLYDPFSHASIREFPGGPVLRSFGEGEAGLASAAGEVRGGTAYWHLNVDLSVPVRRWARALIPDIVIGETPTRRVTLRSALKAQANTVEEWIYNDLVEKRGYPDNAQTEALAERIVDQDIRPTISYLADRANVYSFKPMVIFDLARIQGEGGLGRTWIAGGAGVQVNIVNARLETGYVQTIAGSSDNSRGNLLVRLTMQNFF